MNAVTSPTELTAPVAQCVTGAVTVGSPCFGPGTGIRESAGGESHGGRGGKRITRVVSLAVVVVVSAVILPLVGCSSSAEQQLPPATAVAQPQTGQPTTPSPVEPSSQAGVPSVTSTPTMPVGCDVPTGLTRPVEMEAGEVSVRDVVHVQRTNDEWVSPPNSDGERFAWDQGAGEIGEDEYKAYFGAHTYAKNDDALGNQLQELLHEGDVIRITDTEGNVICYRVTERAEVDSSIEKARTWPSHGVLALEVCSDLEDGVWTRKVVWRADLILPAPLGRP